MKIIGILIPAAAILLGTTALAGNIAIREEGLVANFYFADDDSKQPPVLLLGGSDGGLPIYGTNGRSVDYQRLINKLINSGFCVLATAYFNESGLPKELLDVPLEFYDKALAWLGKHEKVAKGRIAIIGLSKGGELALLLASRHHGVKAVVGVVPSSHVFQGIAARQHNRSSWSYGGKELPFVPYKFDQTFFEALKRYEFHDVYKKALEDTEAAKRGRIPVEKINGAVLLLSGRKDKTWPSTAMCNEIMKTLENNKFAFPYEHAAYDSGHNVFENKEALNKMFQFLSGNYK